MAQFEAKKLDSASINGGNKYTNGDALSPSSINSLVEGVLYNSAEIEKSNQLFSNALIGNKHGVNIRVDDASPIINTANIRIVATEYSPYVEDLSSIRLKKLGKNLLSYPYVNTTKTSNGITYTDNGDGSIHAKGTATGNAWFMLSNTIDFGTETMNAILSNSATNGTYTISKGLYYNAGNKSLSLNFAKGTVVDETYYPQVELGKVPTEYERYKAPVTYSPNSDGLVEGFTLYQPTTTIMSEKSDCIIDISYNRDINKAFTELYNAIISLGGNV